MPPSAQYSSKKIMTQLQRIEAHLEEHGAISNFYAIHHKISLRLGARIWDLKRRGWNFRTEELPNKNTVYHVTKWPDHAHPKGERAIRAHSGELVREFDAA